ncbi:hypothetical protein Efla_003535 [Eimeria flavescens]
MPIKDETFMEGMGRFLLIFFVFPVVHVHVEAALLEDNASAFASLSPEDKEAAEQLVTSFNELKDIHQFLRNAARNYNCRKGGYATQQPRTPPQMKVRIFALAARIRDSVDVRFCCLMRSTPYCLNKKDCRRISSKWKKKPGNPRTSLAAAAAEKPSAKEEQEGGEEEEAVHRRVTSQRNPKAHAAPPPPSHSVGRVPPCGLPFAFRQKDDGPIDLSRGQPDEEEQHPHVSSEAQQAEAEEGITVVSPFTPTVQRRLLRALPQQLRQEESGLPNGFYGASRSFL